MPRQFIFNLPQFFDKNKSTQIQITWTSNLWKCGMLPTFISTAHLCINRETHISLIYTNSDNKAKTETSEQINRSSDVTL